MKNLKIFTLLLVLCCSVVSFAQSVKGSGNVIKDDSRSLSDFTKVHATSGIDAYVTIGNEHKIVIEADDNVVKYIKTEVKEGTLKIWVDKGIKSVKEMKVHITAPSIDGLHASNGADLMVETTIKGKKLVCKATSGADLYVSAEVDEFDGHVSSGADIEMKHLTAKIASLKSISGADLEIESGSVTTLNAVASSSGDIDVSNLTAETCNANASSGSDIEVHATKSLIAKARSGADISYRGNPTVSKKTSGGGEVDAE